MSAKDYSGINFSYAIDADHRFVMLSEGMRDMYPTLEVGAVCHKALYGLDSACPQCPLHEERNREIAVYNPDISRWVTVICVDIEWPGKGTCGLIACNVKGDRPRTDSIQESNANQDEETLIKERLLAAEIHNAIMRDEFETYFQPKCLAEDGRIVGAEALARWTSPTQGEVGPATFIPILEKSGSIVELDRKMWRKTFAQVRQWLDAGMAVPPISVNVSRCDVNAIDVVAEMAALADEFALEPSCIEVEVTETVLSDDHDALGETLERLRARGFVVSIDDFGSGYSSLNMLKDIQADMLKLDLKFLDFTEHNSSRAVLIMRSIIEMSHAIDIPVIVEGVETRHQADVLMKLGCYYCQGYLFHKPMTAEEFGGLLERKDAVIAEGVTGHYALTAGERARLRKSDFDEAVLNSLMTPMVMYELDGEDITITKYNEPFSKVIGADELMRRSQSIQQYIHADDLEKIYEAMHYAARYPRETGRCRIRFMAENGEYRPFLITFNLASIEGSVCRFFGLPLLDDEDEGPVYAAELTLVNRSILRDIAGNSALSDSLIENVIGAIAVYYLKDGELYLKGCNKALLRIFNETEESLKSVIRRNVLPRTAPDDIPGFLSLFHEAINNREKGARGMCRFLMPGTDEFLRCRLGIYLFREYGGGYEFIASVIDERDHAEWGWRTAAEG